MEPFQREAYFCISCEWFCHVGRLFWLFALYLFHKIPQQKNRKFHPFIRHWRSSGLKCICISFWPRGPNAHTIFLQQKTAEKNSQFLQKKQPNKKTPMIFSLGLVHHYSPQILHWKKAWGSMCCKRFPLRHVNLGLLENPARTWPQVIAPLKNAEKSWGFFKKCVTKLQRVVRN